MFLEIIWYNHSAHLMGRPRYTKGIFYHSFHGWYSILLPLPLDCCVLWCLALLSGVSLAYITSPVHSAERRRFNHSISQSFNHGTLSCYLWTSVSFWCLALLSGVSLANITSPVHSVDRRRFKHSISQSFLCVMESMACRGVVKVF